MIDVDELATKENESSELIEQIVFSRMLKNHNFQKTLQNDVAFAIFSLTFVLIYIWFHLESFFMAVTSMVLILLSFPVSYFIYSGIFQVSMNTTLNQMTIFIVLGIAADDIFVFCDAWRQSGQFGIIADDHSRRMSYSFKRSFRAILVTSSTTAIAFLANALSDIRPIRAFGIFAAIIVPVNFLIIILVIPPVQIIHDIYFKNRCAYRNCLRKLCCLRQLGKKQTSSLKSSQQRAKYV